MAEASGTQEARSYGNISVSGQSFGSGTLKIAVGGLAWKARSGSRVVTIRSEDVSGFQWLRAARSQQLRVGLKGAAPVRFEGFRESDYSDIARFLKDAMAQKLDRARQARRGWSWGSLDVDPSTANMLFKAGGSESGGGVEDAFEIPLGSVSNVQLSNKNEVVLDMHVDDTAAREDEELVELRFYVPDDFEADELHTQIKAHADTSAFAGESICSLSNMGIIVPRGRYDVDLYQNYIKMHGKSYDFKVLYSSITKLFVLPRSDEVGGIVSVVMAMDPPIRQGNTMYAYFVYQFPQKDEMEVELALAEDDLKKKYNGKLKKVETGNSWSVFAKILKNLSKTPLHIPKTFRSATGKHAVRTSQGAHDGYLFFLEACFFFINKPPTCVRYDEVDYVEFQRMDLERRFDLSFSTSGGQNYLFSNIEREEFSVIFDFLEKKGVVVENADALRRGRGRTTKFVLADDAGSDSESDDADFDPTKEGAEKDVEEEEAEDSDELEEEEVMDLVDDGKDGDSRPKKKRKRD